MFLTFGQQLRSFALAIDIVTDAVFKSVLETVTAYFERELKISFFEVLIATDLGRMKPRRALRSEWHPGGKEWSETLLDEGGAYNGHVSYAYDKRAELWIVASDRGVLERAKVYENLLHTHELTGEFPPFHDLTPAKTTRTSIMWPLAIGSDFIGLINLESPDILKPTEMLRLEIKMIADSIAYLFALQQAAVIQRENTNRAVTALREYGSTPLPHRRRAFIASAVNADKEVVDAIRRLVSETDIEALFWKEDAQSGNISEQIWMNISTSEIGICYLSEPASASSAQGYRDNQNVLFEAGMMHALTHSSRVMRAWIPVREKDSPAPAFDFAAERMVEVPRTRDGQVDAAEFETRIRRRLERLSETTGRNN